MENMSDDQHKYRVGKKGDEPADEPQKLYPIMTEWMVIGYAYSEELAQKWADVANRLRKKKKKP